MVEETKELTEEEIKEEEDKFFARATAPDSMQRIAQGGEFLEKGPPQTMYNDEEGVAQMRKDAHETFQRCAQLAALENSPGLKLIYDQIDTVSAALHKDNESMMINKSVDPALLQANIFAAATLQQLKAWIESKMAIYKSEMEVGDG